METIAPSLFVTLVVVGVFCAFFLICIQPMWGLVDVAVSKKHSTGVKATVIVLTLLLLGPLMTIGYAFFGTRSKALRRSTVIGFTLLLVSGLSVVALAITFPATQTAFEPLTAYLSERAAIVENTAAVDTDREPFSGTTAAEPAVEMEPFTALHVVPIDGSGWSVSLAQYSKYGPSTDNQIPLVLPNSYPLTQLAVDFRGPTLYAITTHTVGRIVPKTGQFIELEADPAIGKPSSPSAIAFDSKRGLLLIAARSTGYSYDPSSGEWKRLPGLADNNIVALEYAAEEGVLYGLRSKPGGGQATRLFKISPNSPTIQEIDLTMPIPIGPYPDTMAQLCQAGEQLIVVVSPSAPDSSGLTSPCQPALFSVDPGSGDCRPIETQLAAGTSDASHGG